MAQDAGQILARSEDMWLFPTKLARQELIPRRLSLGAQRCSSKKIRRSNARWQTDLFTDYNKVMKSSISGGLITVVPVASMC